MKEGHIGAWVATPEFDDLEDGRWKVKGWPNAWKKLKAVEPAR